MADPLALFVQLPPDTRDNPGPLVNIAWVVAVEEIQDPHEPTEHQEGFPGECRVWMVGGAEFYCRGAQGEVLAHLAEQVAQARGELGNLGEILPPRRGRPPEPDYPRA